MVDVTYIPAIGYMEIVDQQDAAMLLPIIQQHINPGTTVWSDMWAAYNGVAELPGVAAHQTVNHSIQFSKSCDRHPYQYHRIILEQVKLLSKVAT